MVNDSGLAVMSAGAFGPPGLTGIAGRARRGRKPAIYPTPQQIEVLAQVYLGKSDKEIARALSITPVAVKSRMFLLSKFLRVHSRTRLVTLALEQGWLQLPAKSVVPPQP